MTPKRRILLALAIATATLCGPVTPAHAEWVYIHRAPNPYTRTHFYMGASGVAMVVVGERGPNSFLDNGGGFNLFLGGRVHRAVALEFGWQPTFHNNEYDIFGRRIDTIGLDALTASVKVFPVQGAIQPYFIAGGGAYLLGDRLNVFASGPGFQIGGGVDFWLSPWLTLGLQGQYRGVELFDYDARSDNTYLNLISFQGDFTGHF